MKAMVVNTVWKPREGTSSHPRDIEGIHAQQGSRILRNPQISVRSLPVPDPGPGEVLIKTRACGLCGSDVAMVNEDQDGYVFYPYMMSPHVVMGH